MEGFKILTILSVFLGLAAADGGRVSLPDIQPSRCIGKDGVFLPIPGNCNLYIICVRETAVISTCGEYHFDARRSVCDLPMNAGCISIAPKPLPLEENICLGHVDGYKIPMLGSSSKFYLCQEEKAFLQTCGSDQFDRKTMQCVRVNEQPAPRPPVAPCVNVPSGMMLPVSGKPSQYYFCINNKAFIKDCGGNMYFDVNMSACAKIPPRIETPSVIRPSQQVDSAAQELPHQVDLLAQKICQNRLDGTRIAIPGTCSQYYVCIGQIGIKQNCGRMQFSPITNACDLPRNVQCSLQETGVVYGKQHPTVAENSTADDICYGRRDGSFVAAPGKCSEFYFCFRNNKYLKSCGQRHFSPITMSCVDLEYSNCVETASAVQATIVQEEPVELVNACLSRNTGDLLKHPTECGKYLICDNHVAVEMPCPAGLHFNPEKNYCDWPWISKCS